MTFDTKQAFTEAWEEEVKKRREFSPSFKLEDYTATGVAPVKYGKKRNAEWWLDFGPGMVQDWINWRLETRWHLADIEGKGGIPGVEVELNFNLEGLDLPIKGFIDRVFVMPTGEYAIVDLKTGRSPETAEQLGLYRVGLGLMHNVWPDWGYFWSPGGKGHGQPIDLRPWTAERFGIMFSQAAAGINAGVFLPQPTNNCKNWCGVSRYCAAVGGEKARGNDVLAV